MPDRATIEAATPKCPKPVMRGILRDNTACGRLLEWVDAKLLWACNEHGAQYTSQALTRQQQTMRYA